MSSRTTKTQLKNIFQLNIHSSKDSSLIVSNFSSENEPKTLSDLNLNTFKDKQIKSHLNSNENKSEKKIYEDHSINQSLKSLKRNYNKFSKDIKEIGFDKIKKESSKNEFFKYQNIKSEKQENLSKIMELNSTRLNELKNINKNEFVALENLLRKFLLGEEILKEDMTLTKIEQSILNLFIKKKKKINLIF